MECYAISKEDWAQLDRVMGEIPMKYGMPIAKLLGKAVLITVPDAEPKVEQVVKPEVIAEA